MRWGDERAVTVQIGAVLLLAILFTALALYQVNAVPAENHKVEFDHNERVTGDMVELRSAIGNTAGDGGARGVSITLGTQYETQAFAVNPPNPTGTIQTEPTAQNITIEGEGIDLNQTTNYILYQPNYNEYTGAPTTRLEHTLLYNEFDDGNVTVEDSMLFSGNQTIIPIVSGDLSRSEAGTVSVDVETLEGPKTEFSEGEIDVTLPTKNSTLWEQSLEDRDGVTVTSETGYVELELDERYDVTVACIGVGDSSEDSCTLGEFGDEDEDESDGEGVDVNRTFEVQWDDDDWEITKEDEDEEFTVTVTDAASGDPIENAAVDFSTNDSSVTDIDQGESDNETDSEGRATISLDAGKPGDATVYAAAGDDVARLSGAVQEEEGEEPADFQVSIDGTNSPISAGDTLTVDATVSNVGDSDGTQDIVLEIDGEQEDVADNVEIDAGGGEDITLEWETESHPVFGDEGTYTATVYSDDDTDTAQVTVDGSGSTPGSP